MLERVIEKNESKHIKRVKEDDMLSGKFWITPTAVIDVSRTEHEVYARRWAMKVADYESCEFPSVHRPFGPVPTEEETFIFKNRNCDPEALRIISSENGADLRPYMIREHGWVRVREGSFWIQDPSVQPGDEMFIQYWKTQHRAVDSDAANILVLGPEGKPGTLYELTVKRLRNAKKWSDLT